MPPTLYADISQLISRNKVWLDQIWPRHLRGSRGKFMLRNFYICQDGPSFQWVHKCGFLETSHFWEYLRAFSALSIQRSAVALEEMRSFSADLNMPQSIFLQLFHRFEVQHSHLSWIIYKDIESSWQDLDSGCEKNVNKSLKYFIHVFADIETVSLGYVLVQKKSIKISNSIENTISARLLFIKKFIVLFSDMNHFKIFFRAHIVLFSTLYRSSVYFQQIRASKNCHR